MNEIEAQVITLVGRFITAIIAISFGALFVRWGMKLYLAGVKGRGGTLKTVMKDTEFVLTNGAPGTFLSIGGVAVMITALMTMPGYRHGEVAATPERGVPPSVITPTLETRSPLLAGAPTEPRPPVSVAPRASGRVRASSPPRTRRAVRKPPSEDGRQLAPPTNDMLAFEDFSGVGDTTAVANPEFATRWEPLPALSLYTAAMRRAERPAAWYSPGVVKDVNLAALRADAIAAALSRNGSTDTIELGVGPTLLEYCTMITGPGGIRAASSAWLYSDFPGLKILTEPVTADSIGASDL